MSSNEAYDDAESTTADDSIISFSIHGNPNRMAFNRNQSVCSSGKQVFFALLLPSVFQYVFNTKNPILLKEKFKPHRVMI